MLLLVIFIAIILLALLFSLTSNPTLALIWSRLRIAAIIIAPVVNLCFALVYTGRWRWINQRLILGLLVIPFITQLLLWTNGQHELYRSGWHIVRVEWLTLELATGEVGFQLHAAYVFLLNLTTLMIFISALPQRGRLFRWQILGMILGIVSGIIIGFVTTFSFSPNSFFPNLYYLSIFPGAVFYTWAMFRYELLRLSPITYDDILNNLQDNLLVLNHDGRVVQVNDQTAVLFALSRDQLIGRTIEDVLRDVLNPDERVLLEIAAEAREKGERFRLDVQLQGVVLAIDGLPILENKLPIGQIIICRDVSEATFLKEERDRYLVELEQSQREYINLVNNVPGMVYELGLRPDGSFFYGYVSEACTTMNGITPEAVYEDPTLLLTRFAEEDLPEIWPRIKRSAAELSPLNGRFGVSINGEKRWREFFSLPYREDDGTIIWYGIEIDVTEQQQVQETLQHNEEMLRSVITSLDDLIFALDVEGHFVAYYQQAGLETFAPLPEAFVGQHYREVFLPELATKLDVALEKAAADEAVAEFEYTFTSANETSAYLARVSRRYGASGETAGFTVVVHDITQRANNLRKLAASEQRFRAFVELSPTAVAVTNREGEISLLNQRFTALFGYTIEDIPTTDEWFKRAYPDPVAQARIRQGWRNDVEQMINTGMAREMREYPVMTKSGALKYVQIAAAPVGEQVVVNFIDVTMERQAESDLQQAKDAAEAANEAKSRFLANMSHELRTPLNSILGFAQLMAVSDMSPANRQRIEIINHSGQHLLALINDVLSISKIEAGQEKINVAEFDLHETLEQVFSIFVLRAREKRIAYALHIDSAVPKYVEGDRIKLRQIVLNLISNAVKFTYEGQVTVTAVWQSQRASALTLTVIDTGVGISEKDQKLLFQPFTQTTSGRLAQEGTGLGLALVDKYTALMGGEMTVESELSVGSRFTVVMPLKVPKSQPPDLSYGFNPGRIAPVVLEDDTQPRILVVDDLENNLKLLTSYFKMIQVETRVAYNGQEALELVKTFQPHLIIMDLRMPVMNGYEATTILRSQHDTRPIIALTASAYEDEQVILNYGFTDYLRKPITLDTLFKTLTLHLPLKYRYKDEAVQQEPTQLSLPQTIVVQADWLRRFERAAAELNPELLIHLTKEIEPSQPQLASTLITLIEQYHLDKIADWLEHVSTTGSDG